MRNLPPPNKIKIQRDYSWLLNYIHIIILLAVGYYVDNYLSFDVDKTAKIAFRWMLAVTILYILILNILKLAFGEDGDTILTFIRRNTQAKYSDLTFGIALVTVVFTAVFGTSFIFFVVNI